MAGVSEGLGAVIAAFSFWAAVAILGVSGLLTLSKVRHSTGRASRGAGVVFGGLISALLVVAAPSIMVTSSDVASGVVGGEGGGAQRPGAMQYFATLSSDGLWIAGVSVAVWVAAVVATIAAALSRQDTTAE